MPDPKRRDRSAAKSTPRRARRPQLEALEDRLVLYATTGASWPNTAVITYSFVPDGTSVGGVPSNLNSTLNAQGISTQAWEQAVEKAAAAWEAVANINLALVPDDGEAIAAGAYEQGNPNFGDIRIGGYAQSLSTLAYGFLPPPINGSSAAGDIFFNTAQQWNVTGGNYDLETVAIHELGHALGLDHSSLSTAVMYYAFNGIKTSLTSDDISGIQAIYGPRPYDAYNSNGASDANYTSAANITQLINSQNQIAIPNLSLTNVAGQNEWFYVTAPTSTMTVTVQAQGLSTLNSKLAVYSSSLKSLGTASAAYTYGGNATLTVSGVQAGQGYYIRVMSAVANDPASVGAFGLLVNFSSNPQALLPTPSTPVGVQPNQGGGTLSEVVGSVSSTTFGLLSAALGPNTAPAGSDLGSITVGNLSGYGDAMVIAPSTSTGPAAWDGGPPTIVTPTTPHGPTGGSATTPDRPAHDPAPTTVVLVAHNSSGDPTQGLIVPLVPGPGGAASGTSTPSGPQTNPGATVVQIVDRLLRSWGIDLA